MVSKKLTASDYKRIGGDLLTGKTLNDYVRFMQKRFPNEFFVPYAKEWATRFANATEWNYSDMHSRRTLKEVNAKKYDKVI
jgi:hypothetical protein